MIAMAQQFIDHAQAEAEQKARELTTAAQERAREIIVEARSRAEDDRPTQVGAGLGSGDTQLPWRRRRRGSAGT